VVDRLADLLAKLGMRTDPAPGVDPDDDDLLLSDLERKAALRSALAAELRR